LALLRDPGSGATLDDALVLWFPGPASYTGEDCAEFHVHGGRAVVSAVFEVLGRLPGLRPAEPGEFTRRAVINGKLDLTRAEAVADLVDAATERQRRQALGQLQGGLNALYDGCSARVTALLARCEAEIDFPDEDLPVDVVAGIDREMAALASEMTVHLADGRRGERLRQGLSVAILGAPNVGKSSLLNRLAQRDAAIVSEEAGTTRDVVEVVMDLAGFEVILADTAGLRQDTGAVESEGIRRARALASTADLKLVVLDAGSIAVSDRQVTDLIDESTLIVANKNDLAPVEAGVMVAGQLVIPISCLTGAGLDRLIEAIESRLLALWPAGDAGPGPTRERHRAGAASALAALERASQAGLPELKSEDLRIASRSLGRITGRVDVEDLLDVVFRDFCIGK
jgi:tRNA modification GTPase